MKRLIKDLGIVTGVICLLGSVGVGKSTFIKRMIAECKDQGCDYIFKDLGSSTDDSESQQKTIFLLDHAESVSDDVLEECLAIVEKRKATEHPVSLILIGSPDLQSRLNLPRFEPYQCLLAGTCALGQMNDTEVDDYILHRLRLAEYSGETLFTEDAVKSITKFSNGIPRVINTLCGNILFQAGLNQCRVITKEMVDHSVEFCVLEEDVLDTEESTKARLVTSDQHLNEVLDLPDEFVTQALQQVNQMLDDLGQTSDLNKPTSAKPSETSLEPQFNSKIELVFEKPIDLVVTKTVDSSSSDVQETGKENNSLKISDDTPVPVEAIDIEPISKSSHNSDKSIPSPPESEEKQAKLVHKLGLAVVILLISIVTIIWLMEQLAKNQENRNVADTESKVSVERHDELKPIHNPEVSSKGVNIDSHVVEKLRPEKLDQAIISNNNEADDVTQPIKEEPPSEQDFVNTEKETIKTQVIILLEKAQMQEDNNQLTLPLGNNVVETFQDILKLDPSNVDATQGIKRIKQIFIRQAERLKDRGHWKEAEMSAVKALQLDPGNATLTNLLIDIRRHLDSKNEGY
ncbi:MAG: hypothetical protein OEX82_02185 [Nitrosomonas sp.]|nr:hypothetical protein [Nitrosomonas sp.]